MSFARLSASAQRHDVLLAQDRDRTLDQEARALAGIGYDAIAEQDLFVGLEFDLEGHIRLLAQRSHRCRMPVNGELKNNEA